MAYLFIKQKIADFDQWLSVFESHLAQYKASGLEHPKIYRDVDDHHVIICLFRVTDIKQAKNFISASTFEKMQNNSSMIGKPELKFFEEI